MARRAHVPCQTAWRLPEGTENAELRARLHQAAVVAKTTADDVSAVARAHRQQAADAAAARCRRNGRVLIAMPGAGRAAGRVMAWTEGGRARVILDPPASSNAHELSPSWQDVPEAAIIQGASAQLPPPMPALPIPPPPRGDVGEWTSH